MQQRKGIYIAIIISLSIHVIVLLVLNFLHPNAEKTEEQMSYEELIDMDFVEIIEEPQELLDMNRSESEIVKNLIANQDAARSAEERSYSQRSEENLANSTYDNLKDFEKEIFDQLEADRIAADTLKQETENKSEEEQKENYEYWDKSYDGKVTASFSLQGRTVKSLRIPAYLCQQAGQVSIAIEVSPVGTVVNAVINENNTNTQNECLREESLKYALKSTFNSKLSAPKKQKGSITYVFIAQ